MSSKSNSERLEYDADIVEAYLNDWERLKPALRGSHMIIFFREHVQVLRDVADQVR